MSDRPDKFKDPEEALLIERSRVLVAELDKLIQRAKEITQEHKAVTKLLKQRKETK